MFAHPIAQLKHKIDLTVKTTVGGLVVLVAALVALGFLCAALFLWLAQNYSAIIASLVLAGVFVFVALVAVLIVVLMRRREPPPPPPPTMGTLFNDPAMLMAAFDVVRTFGRGRTTAAVLISAFLGGLLLSRSSRKPES